ncbi:MAG TPA: sigma-54 dependent transcriptional regulator, partial [Kofleriaceae bacterium]|nr:sigma-54 dependent transcriptional regulator [Kofleriaceae bacterium]
MAALLRAALRRRGYDAETVASGADALAWVETCAVDIVLTHLGMPGMSGIELCHALRSTHPQILTIVLTGDGLLDSAIAAVRVGAFDYITKPIDLEALVIAIERGMAHATLSRELHRLRDAHDVESPVTSILGDSPQVQAVTAMIRRVADSDAAVLVVGESGTGKELVARAIHDGSRRRAQPFVAINCAALPPQLLESELFGHVKGAFTDARRSRAGLFVQADKGTILLDEVTEMPLEMQAKLLRVLQSRRVRPVGDDE